MEEEIQRLVAGWRGEWWIQRRENVSNLKDTRCIYTNIYKFDICIMCFLQKFVVKNI